MKSPDFDMLIDNKSSVHRYRKKKLLISAGTVHVRVKKMEDAHQGARVRYYRQLSVRYEPINTK
jgi:hypothetical protein